MGFYTEVDCWCEKKLGETAGLDRELEMMKLGRGSNPGEASKRRVGIGGGWMYATPATVIRDSHGTGCVRGGQTLLSKDVAF